MIKKVKTTVPSTKFISDLKGEELVGRFYEKELQKTNQNEFRITISYVLNGKATIVLLTVGLIKKT